MNTSNPQFQKYFAHVLKWEGKTSKDPRDTAVKCAPFAGAFHTNKGVTFCTFKSYAKQLGILPVTYQKFISMSDDDVAKFVLHFMNAAQASQLPDRVALSITEAAWGSGPNRSVKHLQTALNNLGKKVGVTGNMDAATKAAALQVPEADLYNAYWQERKRFIAALVASSRKLKNGQIVYPYKVYENGWNNRINSFLSIFGAAGTDALKKKRFNWPFFFNPVSGTGPAVI